eukprot:scaffold4542_cov80-Isochrysis_galbana.AAC.1
MRSGLTGDRGGGRTLECRRGVACGGWGGGGAACVGCLGWGTFLDIAACLAASGNDPPGRRAGGGRGAGRKQPDAPKIV